MRFMIMVRANAQSESETSPVSGVDEKLMADMAAYHKELAKAGVLLDASGLKPSAQGWRVRYSDGKRAVIDGPFAETKELIAGYTLIQVRSREEAMEWARRFPAPFGEFADGEIEDRRCGGTRAGCARRGPRTLAARGGARQPGCVADGDRQASRARQTAARCTAHAQA